MKLIVLIYIIVTLTIIDSCKSKNYTNHVLYDVLPDERFQLEFLQNLEKQKYINVMFWTKPARVHNNVQVLVAPTDVNMFKERLDHFNLKATVLSDDIQKLFDDQKVTSYTRMKLDSFSWDTYHTLEGIYQWMTDIATQYSRKVNLTAVGLTAEGREILAMEFYNPTAKSTVIVEGAMHGNEWITAEFVTYLIYHIAKADKALNPKLQRVAKKFRWIMIPVANPDGYVYSMNTDRMWRKNRSNQANNQFGVDLNKNFDYNFCAHDGSNNSIDDNYCGPKPFSEPESLAISNYVKKNKEKLNFYFSFHAYGQKIVVPYSDRVKHLENFSEMENYGKQAILRMYKLTGVKYGVGTIYDIYGKCGYELNNLREHIENWKFIQSNDLSYRSAGDSVSWVKKTFNTKYALTFYLRDDGKYGFALPPDMIQPTCKEMLVGLVELMTARHRHMARELFSSAVIPTPSYHVVTLVSILFVFY